MKYKSMILIILTVFVLLSIASVSASDANDTAIASEDTADIELSTDNEIISEDNLQTSEEENPLTIIYDDEEENGTFTELAYEIGEGGDIKLNKSYYIYNSGRTIEIKKSGVIDGNGAVIDMAGSYYRPFSVKCSHVTFTNLTIMNTADTYSPDGDGAIRFSDYGIVTNCNFINNHPTTIDTGGAIHFDKWGTVTNCNFTGNSAWRGGALSFGESGTVTNCTFTGNSASFDGGAIYFPKSGTVTNCNFIGNSAQEGGAIGFDKAADVTYCNFTDNIAYGGSAIRFGDSSGSSYISNSILLNNKLPGNPNLRVDAENKVLHLSGDMYLNAINSAYAFTCTNVTYWSAKGITNTGSSPRDGRVINGIGNAMGVNITFSLVVNDTIVFYEETRVTDRYGDIFLAELCDNYLIVARHESDSYTGAAEIMLTNAQHYVNVTSMGFEGKDMNITAKSNIYNEIVHGGLVFILPNGDELAANYTAGGTWWAAYTFDDYGRYEVSASYTGLDNVAINNGTVIARTNSSLTVDNVVLLYGDSIDLDVETEGAIGITAKIGNKDVYVDGYTIPISDLNAGNHILTVTTLTDELYNPVTRTANITILKANSTLFNINNILFDYNGVGSTTVLFRYATGVKASVINQTDAIINVKVNKITVSNLDVGIYTLVVTTIPDSNHLPVTNNATIVVNPLDAQLIANSITATYNVNKNLVITLKDGNNRAVGGVDVKVVFSNGKKATVITDLHGQIKFPTKGWAPKTYTATISIGNENILQSTKTVKIKVKKATPKLTAKSKSFKKSVKPKKYTITLKTNIKKALAKTKVTLKVKGTTYKATTNAKGKATFKITKLNKKGKFTATITYKGSAYYNKVTKKVKIKVK